MPSEQLIQAAIVQFSNMSKDQRENLLVALVTAKASREMEGVDLVMDPDQARILQPILDDELALETTIQALMRLNEQEEKKSWWRRLFGRK